MQEALHPDKRRWTTTVFFFLAGILAASWSSRIPDVQQNLGLNDAAWGTVLFALPIGLITGMILSSWLVAYLGSYKIMIISCIIASLILWMTGLANSRWQLMGALFLTGFVRTILNISVNTNAVEVQSVFNKPIMSTFHGVWSFACLVAIGIGTLFIIPGIPPKIHFFVIALACISITLLYSRQKNQPFIRPEKKPFFIVPDNYLLLLGLIAFCGMLAESTMFDWSINYFERVLHVEKSYVTLGYTSFIITMAAGRLFGDRMIRRFGYVNMLFINSLLMAAGFTMAALLPYLITAAIGFFIVGIGDSLIVPIVYALSAKTKKMQPGYAIASVTMIGYAGFLVGPLVIGSVSEAFGMQWAFGLVAALCLCITVLSLLIRKKVEL